MYQVKNNGGGPRYFTADGRTVTVQAGETSEPLRLNADAIEAIEEHPDLEVERASEQLTDGAGGGEKSLSKMNKDELLEVAEAAGIASVDREGTAVAVNEATNDELRKAISAARQG